MKEAFCAFGAAFARRLANLTCQTIPGDTAINGNDEQNPRSHVPVTLGARGRVRELVEIANGRSFQQSARR